ncbi:hypothetical protein E2C01_089318 [Portunus trituberculatus]|uniref:Uncharacterized protein n=1 Tax=Portunus trituberculatus TaxID=210409 RepID=A0A5B7JIH4_PORTR|nr:hypothetical protein [Portunus trituberculatus]
MNVTPSTSTSSLG